MSKSKFDLVVAEGHWNDHSNHSVKSLFDLLSDLLKSNPHSYKYTQFPDAKGFDASVNSIMNSSHKYLYIGSHGDLKGVYGSSKANPVTFTIIKNRIPHAKGLYLGTCLFGQSNVLTSFVKDSALVWCSGYRKSVDWVDSSVLDLAFWKIFQLHNISSGKKVELTMIERTAKELQSKYASLILDLGFNIAIRRKGKDGKDVIETVF